MVIEIGQRLKFLYEIIKKGGGNLNYNGHIQTSFGNLLEELLILITNNCSNTINNIFKNNSYTISNIAGCYNGNTIYNFYKNFNNNNSKGYALYRLLKEISIDKYKKYIDDNAVEVGLIYEDNRYETLGIDEFIKNYFSEEYKTNKKVNLNHISENPLQRRRY
jgi:hypothetical protein